MFKLLKLMFGPNEPKPKQKTVEVERYEPTEKQLNHKVKVEPDIETKPEPSNDYWIDYFPVRDKHYPRYKQSWLKTCHQTGIIKLDSDEFSGMLYGDAYSGVEGKEQAIKKLKEYQEQANITLRKRIEVDI